MGQGGKRIQSMWSVSMRNVVIYSSVLNSVVVLFHFNYSLYDYVFDDAYPKIFMSEMTTEKSVNNLD